MCFAPQRRALFHHLNFQKWSEAVSCFTLFTSKCALRHNGVHFFNISIFQKCSEPGVLCAFWLRNMLRATTACNFSPLIWPDGSSPAALASLLFDPPEPQISVLRLCYLFARLHLLSSASFSSLIFFLLLFSSLLWLFPPLLFHLSILSKVWFLNLLRLTFRGARPITSNLVQRRRGCDRGSRKGRFDVYLDW